MKCFHVRAKQKNLRRLHDNAETKFFSFCFFCGEGVVATKGWNKDKSCLRGKKAFSSFFLFYGIDKNNSEVIDTQSRQNGFILSRKSQNFYTNKIVGCSKYGTCHCFSSCKNRWNWKFFAFTFLFYISNILCKELSPNTLIVT